MTEPRNFPGRRSALVLMLVFLVGFAAQLYLVRADRRTALESIEFSTAAGDRAFFPLPENLAQGDPMLRFEGRTFVSTGERPEKDSDFGYLDAGKDESGRYTLYRARDPDNADADKLYVKTSEDRFLALTPQP